MSASTGQLGQDRCECVLESGTVRACKAPSLPPQGKENHQVNPGEKGGKFLDTVGHGRGAILWLSAHHVNRKKLFLF